MYAYRGDGKIGETWEGWCGCVFAGFCLRVPAGTGSIFFCTVGWSFWAESQLPQIRTNFIAI